MLESVILSSNRLQGPLPSFCGSPWVSVAAFDSNLIESLPDLRCYSRMQQLLLQSNPLRGELPANVWQLLPSISILILSNTLLNGQRRTLHKARRSEASGNGNTRASLPLLCL